MNNNIPSSQEMKFYILGEIEKIGSDYEKENEYLNELLNLKRRNIYLFDSIVTNLGLIQQQYGICDDAIGKLMVLCLCVEAVSKQN